MAASADAWIAPLMTGSALAAPSAGGQGEVLAAAISRAPRLARRLADPLPQLLALSLERAHMARWLTSPAALRRLGMLASARCHGAELASWITREDCQAAADRLGEEAWQYGVRHGSAIEANGASPDEVLDRAERMATAFVEALVRRELPALAEPILRSPQLDLPPSEWEPGMPISLTIVDAVAEEVTS
jgi:hypothetical protein